MSDLRPVPDDYAVIAPSVTRHQARVHWNTSYEIVDRWAKETGTVYRAVEATLQPPENWAALVADKTPNQVREALDISHTTYRRFARQTGIRAGRAGSSRNHSRLDQPPPEFYTDARTMTLWALRHKYKMGEERAKKFLKLRGIAPDKRKLPTSYASGGGQPFSSNLTATISTLDTAARYLQRFFVPVCRLSPLRRENSEKVWACGRLELTDAELLEKARAKGWNADGWKMLAERKGFRVGGEMVG